MNYETLLVEYRDTTAIVTVNRPDQLNALNPTVLRELAECASALGDQRQLDAVILTGAGRAFVAGADIKAMIDYGPEEAEEFSRLGHRAFDLIASLPMPVIGAINGFALGGGLELALACDILYGSTKARLGLPEVSLGVLPGWGGTQRLGRLIGWHKARELVFTGKHIKADEAKACGLLLDVFEPEALLDEVVAVAQSIAKNGPLAVRTVKKVMTEGAQTPLGQGMAVERRGFSKLFGTNDQREGMEAFVERRDAEFTRS